MQCAVSPAGGIIKCNHKLVPHNGMLDLEHTRAQCGKRNLTCNLYTSVNENIADDVFFVFLPLFSNEASVKIKVILASVKRRSFLCNKTSSPVKMT